MLSVGAARPHAILVRARHGFSDSLEPISAPSDDAHLSRFTGQRAPDPDFGAAVFRVPTALAIERLYQQTRLPRQLSLTCQGCLQDSWGPAA